MFTNKNEGFGILFASNPYLHSLYANISVTEKNSGYGRERNVVAVHIKLGTGPAGLPVTGPV